jgi:hypothetical protein
MNIKGNNKIGVAFPIALMIMRYIINKLRKTPHAAVNMDWYNNLLGE